MTLSPAIAGPLKSYAVSSLLSLQSTTQTAFTIGYGLGLCSTPEAAWHFITSPGVLWGIACGVFGGVGPYYRARQGSIAVQKGTP